MLMILQTRSGREDSKSSMLTVALLNHHEVTNTLEEKGENPWRFSKQDKGQQKPQQKQESWSDLQN